MWSTISLAVNRRVASRWVSECFRIWVRVLAGGWVSSDWVDSREPRAGNIVTSTDQA